MSFAEAWKKAGEEQDDFEPADGNYTVRIIDADAFEAKTDGREWCKVTLQMIGTDAAGRTFEDFGPAGDHNPVGFRIMREKLVTYGLDPDGIESIHDLDFAMKRDLVGRTADIAVTHKNGYRNVSVSGSRRDGQSELPADGFEKPKGEKTGAPAGQKFFAASIGQSSNQTDDDIPF